MKREFAFKISNNLQKVQKNIIGKWHFTQIGSDSRCLWAKKCASKFQIAPSTSVYTEWLQHAYFNVKHLNNKNRAEL